MRASNRLVGENMEYVQSGILAFIQGATEFLPISSSAHLILFPTLFGWQDQGLPFDIAVHVGTLIASIGYFRQQIVEIAGAWFGSIMGRESSQESKLGWFIIVASIPVAVSGALAYDLVGSELRSVTVIGLATLIFALLLWYADARRRGQRTLNDLRLKDAILIGLGQAIAIIPGTSRSGITITVALMLGMNRKDAARFAFLLAIPAIAMAGGWQMLQLMASDISVDWVLFGFAIVVSAAIAYLSIHYFLVFIEKIGMLPFVVYRVLLAIVIFAFV